MIVKEGSNFVVKSEDGKKTLGTYKTKEDAVKRLQAIEWFKKHKDKGS